VNPIGEIKIGNGHESDTLAKLSAKMFTMTDSQGRIMASICRMHALAVWASPAQIIDTPPRLQHKRLAFLTAHLKVQEFLPSLKSP
jgi:hypothetical protein